MAIFTKINNICRITLDNITKVIYNKTNKMVVVIILTICLILSEFGSVFAVGNGRDESERLSPSFEYFWNGDSLELEMSFAEGDRFCGFYGEMEYNADAFCFEGAEAVGIADGFEFSFGLGDGIIAFMLDSAESELWEGKIVFSFLPIVLDSKNFDFVLVKTDAYLWSEDELVSVCAPSVEISVSCGDVETEKVLKLIAVDLEYGRLRLIGICSCSVAGGFEVAVVDIISASVESLTLMKALPLSADNVLFEIHTWLPDDGRFCVFIRPLFYTRESVIYGNETSFLLIDGEVYGE